MEAKTFGSFLAALRKAQGMTQKELAERLHISDKTVSRWERDEGTPDLAIIPVLAEIFGVSCDELLRGERRSPADRVDAATTAKGERERRRLLQAGLSRYRSQSMIAVGLDMAGLIAALICNLAFFAGRAGLFHRRAVPGGRSRLPGDIYEPGLFQRRGFGLTGRGAAILPAIRYRSGLLVLWANLGAAGLQCAAAAGGRLSRPVRRECAAAGHCWRRNRVGNLWRRPVFCKGCPGAPRRSQPGGAGGYLLETPPAAGKMRPGAGGAAADHGSGPLGGKPVFWPLSDHGGNHLHGLRKFCCLYGRRCAGFGSEANQQAAPEDTSIAPEEISPSTLEDENGNVLVSYQRRNYSVFRISYGGENYLPITVYTYSDLAAAKQRVALRNFCFVVAYVLETSAVAAAYLLRRRQVAA